MPGPFPRSWEKHALLPVVGPIAATFADWLAERGYSKTSTRSHLSAVPVIDRDLRRAGVLRSSGVTWQALEECVRGNARDPKVLATLRVLTRFLGELGAIAEPQRVCDYKDALVADYAAYLADVRGLVTAMISGHLSTISRFLAPAQRAASRTRQCGYPMVHGGNARLPAGAERSASS